MADEVRFLDNPPPVVRKNTERIAGWYLRSPLFLPASNARTFIKIESVGIGRLQDITEKEAKAEGTPHPQFIPSDRYWPTYKDGYAEIWDSINGSGSWASNPYVWRIEFRLSDADAVRSELKNK